MTVGEFALAAVRLAALLLPALIAAQWLRRRFFAGTGAIVVLLEAVVALSVLLVAAEVVGVVSLEHFWPVFVVSVILAAAVIVVVGRWPVGLPEGDERRPLQSGGPGRISAYVAVTVVVGQWGVQTANTLGGGMFNFDTLWYHMPFAARFAQNGSITSILFTQADPFTAYYPANSEVFHALGIIALRNDFLSPFLNLMWLAIGLLAAWCVGYRWHVQHLTLTAGALVLSLPVLSTTQPGEAFNDVAGLAALLAAAALLAYPESGALRLIAAGLALGIAAGTKYTFLVPAFVLLAGITVTAPRGDRARTLGLLGGPLILTGGYWYLRNLIDTGNPLGLRMRLGPILLPGPNSPLATASQQTVFSQIRHVSLWGARFVPGLDHALGPLWPVVLLLYLVAVIAGLAWVHDRSVRLFALAALLAGLSYLFLPTGATGIEQGTTLFQVNLRYATPALALGIVLVPVLVRLRAPRILPALGLALALLVVVTQLERALWPTQTARHLAFLVAAAVLIAVIVSVAAPPRRPLPTALGALAAALVLVGAAYAVQRHYFARRYLVGEKSDPGLAAIYRWAQTVASTRIALYGNVQQYPLYGARDTNRVDYLGTHTPNGGFRPISGCRSWRTTITRGRYQYVVLTPAPTAAIPLAWTQSDPAAVAILRPANEEFVFKITGPMDAASCA